MTAQQDRPPVAIHRERRRDCPADVADLCRKVGDIPGTDFAALLAAIAPDPG